MVTKRKPASKPVAPDSDAPAAEPTPAPELTAELEATHEEPLVPVEPTCVNGHTNNWLTVDVGVTEDVYRCRCGARLAVQKGAPS